MILISAPPEFKNFPLMPLPFQLLSGDDDYRQHLHDLTSFVVAKINARAQVSFFVCIYIFFEFNFLICIYLLLKQLLLQMCGEVYEFGEIENVVDAGAHRLTLITFSVKEVSPNAGRVKVVQAMVFCFGKNHFKLRDLRFKPQVATSSTASIGSSSLN